MGKSLVFLLGEARTASARRESALRAATAQEIGTVIFKAALWVSGNQVPTRGEIALATARIEAQLLDLRDRLSRELERAEAASANDRARVYWTSERCSALSEPLRGQIRRLLAESASEPSDRPRSVKERLSSSLMDAKAREEWGSFDAWMGEWQNTTRAEVRQACEREVVGQADIPEYVRQELLTAVPGPHRSALTELLEFMVVLRKFFGSACDESVYRLDGGAGSVSYEKLVNRVRAGTDVFLCQTKFEADIEACLRSAGEAMSASGSAPVQASVFHYGELHGLAEKTNIASLMRALGSLGLSPTRAADKVLLWGGPRSGAYHWYAWQNGGCVVLAGFGQGRRDRDSVWVCQGDVDQASAWLAGHYSALDLEATIPEEAPEGTKRAIVDIIRGARERIAEYRATQAEINAYVAEQQASAAIEKSD